MKILIVSDSHGHNEYLDDLIRDNKDVDLFLHAGDAEVPAYTIYPFRVVKGNCDYIYDMEKEFIIPTPFGNLLLRHKGDATEKYLKDHEVKIYVYGHTHIKTCKKKNNICYINPGSLVFPRDDVGSYVIIKNNETECFASFINIETKEVMYKYRIYMKDNKGNITSDPNSVEDVKEKEEEKIDKEQFINDIKSLTKEIVKEELGGKGE